MYLFIYLFEIYLEEQFETIYKIFNTYLYKSSQKGIPKAKIKKALTYIT